MLGKTGDARKCSDRADAIRNAFNKEFYKGDGVYLNGSQTALSCAVYQGLVQPNDKPAVLAKLADNVRSRDDHLDIGILGAKYLFHSLSENGHHDLTYRIVTQTSPPSYGDWVEREATTLWEDWKGVTSLNHVMFGDISSWFYQKLAGINADVRDPGFKHVIIRPLPVRDLKWVEAETETMFGTIRVDWKKEADGTFLLNLTIPANTTATVQLPTIDVESVHEGGVVAGKAPNVELISQPGTPVSYKIGSSIYHFHVGH